jgi:hypothetical protein
MTNLMLRSAILVSCAGITACSSVHGRPESISPTVVDSALEFDPGKIAFAASVDWIGGEDDDLRRARNNLVTARMYAVDSAYNRFEIALLNDSRHGNVAADIVTMVLNTTGAAISGVAAKTVLHASSSIIVGSKQAVDKNLLLDRAVSVLIGQMRARRAEIKTRIIGKLDLTYAQWPIALAWSEAADYEQAGSLLSALNAAAADASTKAESMEQRADLAVRRLDFDDSAESKILSDYFFADALPGVEQRRREALVKQAISDLAIDLKGVRLDIWLETANGADKFQILLYLLRKEPDPAGIQELSTGLAALRATP